MVRLFVGDNNFEVKQALDKIKGDFLGEFEAVDGGEVSSSHLLDLLSGMTLFSEKRMVVISGLSEQKDVWDGLPEMLERLSDDTEVVLVEPKVDKRTKTYKWLVKNAKVSEHASLTDRQRPAMIDWVLGRAQHHGYSLDRSLAGELVDRLGYDQLRMDMVLEQLGFVDAVSKEVIDAVVPLARSESAFELFEAALQGRVGDVQRIVSYLEQTSGLDGAYMTMGLLASQLVNLNGLVLSAGDSGQVASDLGAHPFVLKKLSPLARNISAAQLGEINHAFARADRQMKSTGADPWMLVEMALVATAQIAHK